MVVLDAFLAEPFAFEENSEKLLFPFSDNSETFLLPGDSEEMRRFRDTTMQTSKVQIQLFFPSANIQMK